MTTNVPIFIVSINRIGPTDYQRQNIAIFNSMEGLMCDYFFFLSISRPLVFLFFHLQFSPSMFDQAHLNKQKKKRMTLIIELLMW